MRTDKWCCGKASPLSPRVGEFRSEKLCLMQLGFRHNFSFYLVSAITTIELFLRRSIYRSVTLLSIVQKLLLMQTISQTII